MRSHGLGRVLRAGAADRALDALAPRDGQRHHPIDRSVSCRSFPTTGRSASGGRSPSGGPRYGCSSRPRPAPMASRLRSRRPGGVCMARDRRGGSPAGNHGVAKAMFLNALECDDAAKSIIKSRAEPSRAEPSRAEPSRAEPSRAEPSRAEPSRAEPSRAEPSRASDIVQVLAGRLAPFPPRPAGRSRTLSRQLRTAARLRRCGAKPPVRAAGDTVAAR